jgi:hypothetical protein
VILATALLRACELHASTEVMDPTILQYFRPRPRRTLRSLVRAVPGRPDTDS